MSLSAPVERHAGRRAGSGDDPRRRPAGALDRGRGRRRARLRDPVRRLHGHPLALERLDGDRRLRDDRPDRDGRQRLTTTPRERSPSTPASRRSRSSVSVLADALAEGVETFRVDLSSPSGAAIAYGQATGRIHDPGKLFTVAPCRVLDTRDPAGPYGGPALARGSEPHVRPRRTLRHPGHRPRGGGEPDRHRAHGAGQPDGSTRPDQAVPSTSTLNYASGQTRANNAVVGLSPSGALAVRCAQASGTAHVDPRRDRLLRVAPGPGSRSSPPPRRDQSNSRRGADWSGPTRPTTISAFR